MVLHLSGSTSPLLELLYCTLHRIDASTASKKREKKKSWLLREEIHSTGSLTWTGLDGKSESSSCRIRTEVESGAEGGKQTFLLNGGRTGEGTYLLKRREFWNYIDWWILTFLLRKDIGSGEKLLLCCWWSEGYCRAEADFTVRMGLFTAKTVLLSLGPSTRTFIHARGP